jgi:excisionase family DNA binding protein
MSIPSDAPGHDERLGRLFYSVRETEQILNLSHATVYRLLGSGRLTARKVGSKTLVCARSIERLVAELPAAKIRGAVR